MNAYLASKADTADLQTQLKAEVTQFKVNLTVRMCFMLSTAVGILIVAMKLMQ